MIDPRLARRLHALEAHGVKSAITFGARVDWLKEFYPSAQVQSTGGDPAHPTTHPDASFDLAFALDYLERLRMDQLYMVASEARRVLRPGGLCVLRALSFPASFLRRPLSQAHSWLTGEHLRELTHYISPEDWKTLEDFRVSEGLLTRQTLVLERLAN